MGNVIFGGSSQSGRHVLIDHSDICMWQHQQEVEARLTPVAKTLSANVPQLVSVVVRTGRPFAQMAPPTAPFADSVSTSQYHHTPHMPLLLCSCSIS